MKIKLFAIVAAIAALMSPLVASAATLPAIPFSDLSSIDFSLTGTAKNATFTVTDLNSATKKVNVKYKLSNGVIDAVHSSAEFIFDKNVTIQDPAPGLKITVNATANYDIGQAVLSATLFSAGPRSTASSGQGGVNIYVPKKDDFIYSGPNPTGVFASMTGVVTKAPVTGSQIQLDGAVGVTAVVKRDGSSAIFKIGAIKPIDAVVHTVIANYSGITTASPGIHVTSDTSQHLKTSGAVLPGGKISSFTKIP
jgi:hypothetical protein